MSKFSYFIKETDRDDDHICTYYTDSQIIKIECENCIDQVKDQNGCIYDCKCYNKTIIKKTCVKCEVLKDCIEKCQEEIAKMLSEEEYKIKNLCTCDENVFKKIPELVRKMRHCKRVLLQKS
jgi:GTPase Era involved in 16S rRNA processing